MNLAKYSYAIGTSQLPLCSQVGTDFEIHDWLGEIDRLQHMTRVFMKHFEILASFYFIQGLREEGTGLAIVACALLIGGIFIWRVTRSLKKDTAEELERERHGENIP